MMIKRGLTVLTALWALGGMMSRGGTRVLQGVLATFIFVGGLLAFEARANDYPITTDKVVDYDRLKSGFINIPDESKMRCYWFWLNGTATKESITQDLEAMKAKGYGGALLGDNGVNGPPFGPTFMSEEWLANFGHAVKESGRLGLELSANIQSGFGDPGNPDIKPENSMKIIAHTEIHVTGPRKFQEELPNPGVRVDKNGVTTTNIYYKDIAVQAFRKLPATENYRKREVINWQTKALFYGPMQGFKADRKQLAAIGAMREPFEDDIVIPQDGIVDLTANLSDGVLTWDVPEGEWTIVRYGMVSTGKRNEYAHVAYKKGLCYDQLNADGIRAQWKDVVQVMVDVAKKNGNGLKYVHSDSWEMGMTNWTQGFMEKFKALRGYDMTPFLAVLTGKMVGSRELSNRFLEDFRLTLADLVAEENYGVFKELAHANGLRLHSESGGPHNAPIDALRTLGVNDVPMSEFWAISNSHRKIETTRIHVKQGSCAAHIYGKRYLAAEGPTSIGPQWERAPRELKGNIDKVFCIGVNRIFWHTYTSAPDKYGIPGLEYFAGTHMNRHVTWFDQADAFVGYINRCQHLLSQGLYKADVLSYYGSDNPNYIFLESELPLPSGYKWDMCNTEVILTRATAKDGRIYLPDGMNYSLLHLDPNYYFISLPVLKKIEQMVKDGIVLVGLPPERAAGLTGYPESDAELKAITQRLWGKIDQKTVFMNSYGKGRVYAGKSIGEVLELEKIGPDFSYAAADDVDLSYIHRFSDDVEIYYVAHKWAYKDINAENYEDYRFRSDVPDRYVQATCSFRVDGDRTIERFDPVTGEITPVKVYQRKGGYYEVPTSFAPEGSAFFVFRKAPAEKHVTSIAKDGKGLVEGNDPLVANSSGILVCGDGVEVIAKGSYELAWSDGRKSKVNVPELPKDQVIDGSWKISFMERPSLGEVINTETDVLKCWTEFSERAIKYYSGTARYSKSFTVSVADLTNKRVYLDLGNVLDIVTVRLNGKELRTCWIAPFRVDVTEHLVKGKNSLELDVTNCWPNRLIGDGKLPIQERRTRSNAISKFQKPDSDTLLRKSGLLGPVKLQYSALYKQP